MRARRLEPAGGERRSAARRGRDRAVRGAMPDALAVNDHRAREREPLDAGARHRGEQHRGPGIVRRRVVGQVLHVDAEPDLGGEMHHRLDAAQRAIDRARRRACRRGGTSTPAGGVQCSRACTSARSESSTRDLVAAREQLTQHMLADEAGAAGEQNPHRRVTAMRIVSSAPSGVPLRRIGRRGDEIVAREVERRDLARQDRDRLDRHRDRLAPPIGRRPAEPGAVRHHEHNLARRRAHHRADVAEGGVRLSSTGNPIRKPTRTACG